jgi:ubiquinone/menaquinone biosynthesis C-methylase UbiE/predicted RNA-binding Zn-ribbon protein involved in translation (DUF1610 family)
MTSPTNNTPDTPPVCDYEGSDYQSTFWDTGGRAYEDGAEAVALRRLLSTGEFMLEVGAGAGRNTPRYNGYQRIVVMDYSLTQLQQAQARLGKSDRYVFVAADVYRLPFVDGLFDGATMIRVLHHMADGPQALREIRRTLQSGAIFILEFANKQNIKAILRYWLGKQDWNPFDPDPVEFVALNYDFHPRTTRQWLRDTGFVVERTLTVSHFRLGALKRLLPTPLLVAMDSVAQLSGNWWQLTPSVFTRNRAVGETPLATPGTLFRCPTCGDNTFDEHETHLDCQTCGDVWAIRDGIYDFKAPMT